MVDLVQLKHDVEMLKKRMKDLDAVDLPIQIMNNGQLPVYANLTDAGADIHAAEDIQIAPGEIKIVKTGIKMAIPRGYEVQIRPRSGISSKITLSVANAPGTIDTGYRGEVGVIMHNTAMKNDAAGHIISSMKNKNAISVNIKGEPEDGLYEDGTVIIHKGDRIAQMVLAKVIRADFVVIDNVDDIAGDRGGGFGSTGV